MSSPINDHNLAYKALRSQQYQQATQLYEQLIKEQPQVLDSYWYLGIAYLLQNEIEEAQGVWLTAIFEVTAESNIDQRSEELTNILKKEAQIQREENHLENIQLLREQLLGIEPEDVENVIELVRVSAERETLTSEKVEAWEVTQKLESVSPNSISPELVLEMLKAVLRKPFLGVKPLIKASFNQIPNQQVFLEVVMLTSLRVANEELLLILGIELARTCYELRPDYLESLKYVSIFSTEAGKHQDGIATAKEYYENSSNIFESVTGTYLILRALQCAGAWLEVEKYVTLHKQLLQKVVELQPTDIDPGHNETLLHCLFVLPYIEDNPQEHHQLFHKITEIFSKNLPPIQDDGEIPPNPPLKGGNCWETPLKGGNCWETPLKGGNCWETPLKDGELREDQGVALLSQEGITSPKKRMRIGYIAATFRRHSVGWLSRWLLKFHDPNEFEVIVYLPSSLEDEVTQEIVEFASVAHRLRGTSEEKIKQIQSDQLDILVDLDSVTYTTTLNLMAHRIAPIQVTWLGWDAVGVPTIDYFIADPYVLPDNAQDYYQEKIWRLPHTYLGVNGFETAVPTRERQQLGIPHDAVVYFSAQTGRKRNPHGVRLQMRILREVPNSYFLLKGKSDETIVQEFFSTIAEEEGVDFDRLKFLPLDAHEMIHRANLSLADVVLDTYPYNGATTTLETLWMGIPLVTRVGKQFAARNSYTFLKNAGVEEGIAWTDEEYIQWGIQFGLNEELRKQVHWKLKEARKKAPLWNGKQFTTEMERAYRQMWEQYLQNYG